MKLPCFKYLYSNLLQNLQVLTEPLLGYSRICCLGCFLDTLKLTQCYQRVPEPGFPWETQRAGLEMNRKVTCNYFFFSSVLPVVQHYTSNNVVTKETLIWVTSLGFILLFAINSASNHEQNSKIPGIKHLFSNYSSGH